MTVAAFFSKVAAAGPRAGSISQSEIDCELASVYAPLSTFFLYASAVIDRRYNYFPHCTVINSAPSPIGSRL